MPSAEEPEYSPASNAKREIERLQKQHAWMRKCLDGKIVFAPIDMEKPDLKLLDIGCADGALLRDLREQVAPTAELVGSDVTADFLPTAPDGNIRYMERDVCNPPGEDLAGHFNFTNARLVLPFTGKVGPDVAIANMAATLAPGGWLQGGEIDIAAVEEGRPAFNATMRLMESIMVKAGLQRDVGSTMKEAYEKAGLENVTIQRVRYPAGRLLDTAEDIENSLLPWKLSIPNLVKICKSMGIEHPESMTDNLAERFEQEMLEHGAAYTMIIALGQKK